MDSDRFKDLRVIVAAPINELTEGRPPSPSKSDHSPISQAHSVSAQSQNLNIRAAVVHAVGDLVQSVGVIMAALLINFNPSYQIADPLCTYIFSVIVLFTTVPVFNDCYGILMEYAPKNADVKTISKDLKSIKGV